MKYYSPTGRRNHGRPLKRILDMWGWNGSTSDPTLWKIYDDDDDDDDDDKKRSWVMIWFIRRSSVAVTKHILEFHLTTAVLCHGLHNFIELEGGGADQHNSSQQLLHGHDMISLHTETHSGFRLSTWTNSHTGYWTVPDTHADYHSDAGAFCCLGGTYNLECLLNLECVLHDTHTDSLWQQFGNYFPRTELAGFERGARQRDTLSTQAGGWAWGCHPPTS